MKFGVYILSLAIALNLGTHITVSCNMPACAMKTHITCSCDKAASNKMMHTGCDHLTSRKGPISKCHQNRIDGNYTPTITITNIDVPAGFISENSLLSINMHSSLFTPHITDFLHFKPDKYLNLPLLI